LNGVKYVHQQGFCHLDLRVENIMIDEEYNIKIVDFGNAEEL
jgi:serine/threonine protein kinase